MEGLTSLRFCQPDRPAATYPGKLIQNFLAVGDPDGPDPKLRVVPFTGER